MYLIESSIKKAHCTMESISYRGLNLKKRASCTLKREIYWKKKSKLNRMYLIEDYFFQSGLIVPFLKERPATYRGKLIGQKNEFTL